MKKLAKRVFVALTAILFVAILVATAAACENSESTSGDGTRSLAYKLTGDETGYIVTKYTGTDLNIVIPSEYKGLPVTEIESCSFSNTKIESISIPDSVTKIGYGAFSRCEKLENATIPDKINVISASAFSGCTSLKKIDIPSNVSEIGSSAFSNCISLESVVVPESVKIIGEEAFLGCSGLKSITLPFIGASSTESEKLDRYSNMSDNSHFGYIFGAVVPSYSFDSGYFKNPDFVPKSLEEVIITGGDVVAANAFYKCENIKKITLPDSISKIYSDAFNGCTALEELNLGSNIKSLSQGVIATCASLKNIYYNGTFEEWKSINKDSYWNGYMDWGKMAEYWTVVTLHCSDTSVANYK